MKHFIVCSKSQVKIFNTFLDPVYETSSIQKSFILVYRPSSVRGPTVHSDPLSGEKSWFHTFSQFLYSTIDRSHQISFVIWPFCPDNKTCFVIRSFCSYNETNLPASIYDGRITKLACFQLFRYSVDRIIGSDCIWNCF